jgi:hypothetical protein
MTITFENDNDVIIYGLEKVISYARRNQQIFVAQCVWWLASIIGLESELVNYIDNIQSRINVAIVPKKTPSIGRTVSPIPRDFQEEQRQDKILKECEEYLKESRRLRSIAVRKAIRKTSTGLINPTAIFTKYLRKKDRSIRKREARLVNQPEEIKPKLAGIDQAEISRRKAAGECLRCAWPSDTKGTHRVKNCIRPIKLDKGTANSPKAKEQQKAKQTAQEIPVKEESSELSSCEESSDDSL